MGSLNEIKDLMRRIDESFRTQCLLNEGLSQTLYHFTSLSNGFDICKGDVIYLQSAYAKDSDNYDKKRKFYLSCTRIYSSRFGYSRGSKNGGVRIVLDGNTLSNTLKGKPVNYWGGGVFNDKFKYYETMPKDEKSQEAQRRYVATSYKMKNPDATPEEVEDYVSHNFDNERQFHSGNESEDRVFSYHSAIHDAHKMIKSVDFFMPDLDNNEKFRQIAVSVMRTPLQSLVRIFDNERDFNNPGGKPVDIWKKFEQWGYPDVVYNGSISKNNIGLLKSVLLFIVFGNPRYDGKKLGEGVSSLLDKYGLSEYTSIIGDVKRERDRTTFNYVAEHLDSVRRDLSDRPNRFTSKVVQMMSDYFKELGANTFRDACSIKSKMVDDAYYERHGMRPTDFYDNIDYDKKVRFLVVTVGYAKIIITDPYKDKFAGLFSGERLGDMQTFADGIAREVMEYHDYGSDYTHSRSKNVNSMYQYIYKLLRTGTVQQVLDAFKKIGVSNDYLSSYGLDINYKEISWMDTYDYDTLLTYQMSYENNADSRKVNRIKDNELVAFFGKETSDGNSHG